MVYSPADAHPSQYYPSGARLRVTSFIETNALPLSRVAADNKVVTQWCHDRDSNQSDNSTVCPPRHEDLSHHRWRARRTSMYIDLDAQSRPQNGVVYTVIFTTAGIACILYLEYGVLHITAGIFSRWLSVSPCSVSSGRRGNGLHLTAHRGKCQTAFMIMIMIIIIIF